MSDDEDPTAKTDDYERVRRRVEIGLEYHSKRLTAFAAFVDAVDDRLRNKSPFERRLRRAIHDCWGPDPSDHDDRPTQEAVAEHLGYADTRGLEKRLTSEDKTEREQGSRRPGLWERNTKRRPPA